MKILTNIYECDKFYELKMMINGVRVNKSFPFTEKKSSKDKALAKAIAYKKATNNSFKKHEVPLDRNPEKVNFRGLYELYKPELLKLKGGANTAYLIDSTEENMPWLLTTMVSDISEETFKKVVNKLTENGYAKSTINKYLSLFSMVLKNAKEAGYPVENYAIGLQYSETELDNKSTEIVSRDELKTILAEIRNTKTRLAVEFLFHTATRRSEIVNAKYEHINYDEKTLMLYDTKNGKSHTVILNNTCMGIIEKLKKMDHTEEGHLFQSDNLNEQEGGKFQKDCWTRAWRRAVKRLHERTKEDKWLRKKLHTLRHSRITEYSATVPNLIVLQEITGHKDPRSLLRYSHTSTEQKRALLGDLAKE